MATIYIMILCLFVICILLMRVLLKREITIFDLNEKLNLSDQEYIDLFNENLKLTEKISELKLMKRIKNLKVE